MEGFILLVLAAQLLQIFAHDDLKKVHVIYINLDHKVERRENFLRQYSELSDNLHRVKGIYGANDTEILQFLHVDLSLIPGLAEVPPGEPEWDGKSKRPQWNTGPMWRGAIGCTLAHLRAAQKVLALNLEYALIIEDDMTTELVPYWPKEVFSNLLTQLPSQWEAVQLSVIAGTETWDKVRNFARDNYAAYITIPNIWLASNGAYLLSRRGAQLLMNLFRHPKSGRFDLSSLRCINADLCLLPSLQNKYLRLPPMFLHAPLHASRDSDIAGLESVESEAQVAATRMARDIGLAWAKESFETYSAPIAIVSEEKVARGSCRPKALGALLNIPVLLISTDEDRSETVTSAFGCAELTRIPAVSDDPESEDYWELWIAKGLSSLPGVAEAKNGFAPWDGKGKRTANTSSPLFQFNIQRTLSHIRAAAALVESGAPHALVIEDSVSLDFLRQWSASKLSLSLMVDTYRRNKPQAQPTHIQLSVTSEQAMWTRIVAMLRGAGLYSRSAVIPDLSVRGMGAYILTQRGAKAIIDFTYNHMLRKIDLSMLNCINFDVCIVGSVLRDKAALMPPVFIDGLIARPVNEYEEECTVDADGYCEEDDSEEAEELLEDDEYSDAIALDAENNELSFRIVHDMYGKT